jgi:2,4-dienoyl-CoA reductase-like NADH-dependent reductase (Old Yellow Enzyme family)
MRGHSYGEPIAFTKEQIKTEIVDRFVYAAKFAKDCGFDGIQACFIFVNSP